MTAPVVTAGGRIAALPSGDPRLCDATNAHWTPAVHPVAPGRVAPPSITPAAPTTKINTGVSCENRTMTTPRGAMTRLLDSHPWTTPRDTVDAVRFHAALPQLLRVAQQIHGDDRIARLVVLRLDVFLAHWPHPPHAGNSDRFIADAEGLCEHDVPRLRETLRWAPVELPQQRAPRLGVASLDTA